MKKSLLFFAVATFALFALQAGAEIQIKEKPKNLWSVNISDCDFSAMLESLNLKAVQLKQLKDIRPGYYGENENLFDIVGTVGGSFSDKYDIAVRECRVDTIEKTITRYWDGGKFGKNSYYEVKLFGDTVEVEFDGRKKNVLTEIRLSLFSLSDAVLEDIFDRGTVSLKGEIFLAVKTKNTYSPLYFENKDDIERLTVNVFWDTISEGNGNGKSWDGQNP